MEQKDIPALVQTMLDFQKVLLEGKADFIDLEEKVKGLLGEKPESRELKKLSKHVKTWLKVLSLWEELKKTLGERKSHIITLIKEAETKGYIELEPFVERFESYINNTAFLSINAFETDNFEGLIKTYSLESSLSKGYLDKVREIHQWNADATVFLEATKKSVRDYKYYHLKYEMQLPEDQQLEDIDFLEKEIHVIKEGQYEIPEDRVKLVIHKLVTGYSGKRHEQEFILNRLKAYKPMIGSLPVSDDDFDDSPPIVDF
ncbi:MAG: hypothetical protein IEMM0008_1255 [bacterium]|nr:MAG: hypothetical protein IEMM0008_1255 [bacterium]